MSDIAIKVENLGKRYRIGEFVGYQTLRESLVNAISKPFRALRSSEDYMRQDGQYIWALRNVSFEVKQGEVVGIIGRNGAGKTTILKILGRITEPTEGYAEIRGRVGSLLEVGTGFHPELTGRENIYLNGAVMGMKRKEIDRKFAEIVDFSGVAKFLDTPLKRYSGGMQVRLAFAVAAHLEPEILLVDEVLAVGDAEFQKKCLGKMGEIAHGGRTVLFVSHNMNAVLRLCERVILLDEGKLTADGPTHQVIQVYLRSGFKTPAERVWEDKSQAPGDDVARLRAVRICNKQGEVVESVDIREPVGVQIEYWNLKPFSRLWPLFHFYNEEGIFLFVSADHMHERNPQPVGLYRRTCWIPGNFLAEGGIVVSAFVSSLNPPIPHAYERDAVTFQVVDKSQGDGVRGNFANVWPGVIRPFLKWSGDDEPEEVC